MKAAVLRVDPLGSRWETIDPFLVCVHHVDDYPRGNAELGPDASLSGRTPGRDMEGRDGWRMYFGHNVPGFPAHPHRGFETITIVRQGTVDHSDSLGASARFGAGDVQWLTAGRGIVHAEMFPLLDAERRNPLELLQIWLNLPADRKLAEPDFRMFWSEDIPKLLPPDARGQIEIRCIAGTPIGSSDIEPSRPPRDSWAADPRSDLAIWTISMAAGARFSLPPARGRETRRQLFFFKGATLSVAGRAVTEPSAIEVDGSEPIELVNGPVPGELLMLQGRPIGEPVVNDGPFVMNSAAEIRQAYADYRASGFGDWAWPSRAPVHGAEKRRFACR